MSAYASVAQLRAYLKQAQQDAATTATLEDILDRASAFVDGEIGHAWGTSAAGTRTLYGDGTSYLQLPADYQAGSVTGVTTITGYVAPSYVEEDGFLIVTDSLGRMLTPTNVLIYQLDRVWSNDPLVWSRGIPYTIAATFGYGAIPADLVQVVLEIAGAIWKEKDSGFATVIGTEGGGAVNVKQSLTPRAQAALEHHKVSSSRAGVY